MPEEKLENEQSPEGENPQEKSEEGENLEEKSEEQVDTDKEIRQRDAQISHWREKAKKLEEENKKLQPKKPEPENVEDKVEEWEGTLDPLENARLGKAISDYSEEELEEIIMPMAKGKYTKNIEGILKAVKDPTVQLAIKAKREKVESEKATPSPTSPANIGGKTDKDIQGMSNKEYGEFLRQNIGKRRTGTRGI